MLRFFSKMIKWICNPFNISKTTSLIYASHIIKPDTWRTKARNLVQPLSHQDTDRKIQKKLIDNIMDPTKSIGDITDKIIQNEKDIKIIHNGKEININDLFLIIYQNMNQIEKKQLVDSIASNITMNITDITKLLVILYRDEKDPQNKNVIIKCAITGWLASKLFTFETESVNFLRELWAVGSIKDQLQYIDHIIPLLIKLCFTSF